MRNYPEMIFRITMPFGAAIDERSEFAEMNVARSQ